MPPKSKKTPNSEATIEDSDASFAKSTASTVTVTSEQLERILEANHKSMLEANHKSMLALLATLPPPSAPSSSRPVQIKIPKWADEDIPYEYFNKFERAMAHNGIARGAWGQLLPVYLSGRAQASYAQVNVGALDDYISIWQGSSLLCSSKRRCTR